MRCPVSYRTSSVARIVRDGSMRLRRVVAPAKATACRSATSYVEGRCPMVKCTENVAHPPFDAKTRDTVRAIADSRCSSDARSKNTTAVTGVTTARGPCEGGASHSRDSSEHGALHSRDAITCHIGTCLVALARRYHVAHRNTSRCTRATTLHLEGSNWNRRVVARANSDVGRASAMRSALQLKRAAAALFHVESQCMRRPSRYRGARRRASIEKSDAHCPG